MNFEPMFDRLLVERMSTEEVTNGGIVIPEKAQLKQTWGTVQATGCGRMTPEGNLVPLKLSVGDVILFEQYGGEDITIDEKEYLIIKENCVMGRKVSGPASSAEKPIPFPVDGPPEKTIGLRAQ
jgi:chaperonin GroES